MGLLDFDIGQADVNVPQGTQSGRTPGASSTTGARAPAPTSLARIQASSLGMVIRDDSGASRRVGEISAMAERIANTVRGSEPASGRATRVTQLLGQIAPMVGAAATYISERRRSALSREEGRESTNPLDRGAALRGDDEEAVAPMLERIVTDLTRALDTAALAARRMESELTSNDPLRGLLQFQLGNVAMMAALLGWQVPATLDDAVAARATHEACTSDVPADGEHCFLLPGDRNSLALEVSRGLEAAMRHFVESCRRQAAIIQSTIDRDQKLAELVAEQLLTALLDAVTGGLGGKAAGSLAKGAQTVAAAESASAAASRVLRTFGTKFTKDVIRTATAKATKFVPSSADDPGPARRETVRFLQHLPKLVDEAAAAFDFRTLGDEELSILAAQLREMSLEAIGRRVDAITALFRDQIEPIDRPVSDGTPDMLGRTEYTRAARIRFADHSKLALVRHETEHNPALSAAARAGLATMDLAVDTMQHLGQDRTAQTEQLVQYVKTPYERIEFIRWIEPDREKDIDLTALAATKVSLELEPEQVDGVPLVALVPRSPQ